MLFFLCIRACLPSLRAGSMQADGFKFVTPVMIACAAEAYTSFIFLGSARRYYNPEI